MCRGIKTDQGGSVATFVVIGIILTVALFGSILYLRQHSEQARRDQAIAEYDKQNKTEETDKTDKAEDVEVVVTSEVAAPSEPSAPVVSNTVSANLPNTGPGSVFVESIGVFLLTTAIASYFGSRRTLARYL